MLLPAVVPALAVAQRPTVAQKQEEHITVTSETYVLFPPGVFNELRKSQARCIDCPCAYLHHIRYHILLPCSAP